MATLIDGKTIAEDVKAEVAQEVNRLLAHGVQPCLAVILAGDNPASHTYVRAKQKSSKQVGVHSIQHRLSEDITETDLLDLVDKLNQDDKVHGILVQLPLPEHINENKIIESIAPNKDVDGFHPYNVGRLSIGLDTFISCTPYGVSELISRYGIDTTGKHVVIVGRSNIVGKPLMNLLVQKKKHANATVTVCHSRTKSIEDHTQRADILVAAIGKARFVTVDMVKPGAIVIDVGINRIEVDGKYRLVGDVDFKEVRNIASAITPVPGGVGPMTVAMLMKNVVKAATRAIQTS